MKVKSTDVFYLTVGLIILGFMAAMIIIVAGDNKPKKRISKFHLEMQRTDSFNNVLKQEKDEFIRIMTNREHNRLRSYAYRYQVDCGVNPVHASQRAEWYALCEEPYITYMENSWKTWENYRREYFALGKVVERDELQSFINKQWFEYAIYGKPKYPTIAIY